MEWCVSLECAASPPQRGCRAQLVWSKKQMIHETTLTNTKCVRGLVFFSWIVSFAFLLIEEFEIVLTKISVTSQGWSWRRTPSYSHDIRQDPELLKL